jgi:Rrf2 family protein
MKISKRAQYGLTAVVRLARNKNIKAVSIRQISNVEGVPFAFLNQIFAVLEKAGLIKGKHGANGGYFLAKPPSRISVFDIVGLLEDVNTVKCGLCPKIRKCPTKNVWHKVDKSVEKTLKSIKLSDLI